MPKRFEVIANGNKSTDSDLLFHLRREIGFSQAQLAKEWNVSPGTIALWETGRRKIPGPVKKLIEIYKKDIKNETLD